LRHRDGLEALLDRRDDEFRRRAVSGWLRVVRVGVDHDRSATDRLPRVLADEVELGIGDREEPLRRSPRRRAQDDLATVLVLGDEVARHVAARLTATAHARRGRVLVARFGFAFALARRRQRMARLLAAHLTRRVVAVAETFARRTEGRVAAGVDLVAVVQADLEEANDTLALELDVAALGGPSDGALELRGDDAAAGGAGFVARAGAQLGALDRGHLACDFDLLAAVRQVAVAGEVAVGDRH